LDFQVSIPASNEHNPYRSDKSHVSQAPSIGPRGSRPLSIGGVLAWIVILTLTTLLVLLVAFEQFSAAKQVGGDAEKSDLMQVEIQSKVVVGQNNLSKILPAPDGGMPPTEIPSELDAGCYEQRLVYASLKSELEGPESAQAYLAQLDDRIAELQQEEAASDVPDDKRFKLTEDQKKMRATMDALLEDYSNDEFDSSDIPEESKTLLKERLGFPAELFLLPEGTTAKKQRDSMLQNSAMRILGLGLMVFLGLGALLVGFGLIIGLAVMIRNRRLVSYFFHTSTDHNLYIQTFAIWMAYFFGGSILLGALNLDQRSAMMLQPVIFFSSLACLFYPVIRGISFRQMRFDVGLTLDRPAGDVLQSGVSYLATIPCLIPGFIFVAAYSLVTSLFQETHEFARQTGPGHPIQEYIAEGDFTMLLMVFITACVAAPIVEETMFRGVLYRHLRDWSQTRARWASIFFSAVLNGFIFASIHPQGIAGIPVLMTLAICFSLVREWRNSLLTPMLMHAIHNTLVTCVSLLIL
jgi:membrane protease YdiL (CAAX protease family)